MTPRMPLPARVVRVDALLGQVGVAGTGTLGLGDRGSAVILAGLPVLAPAFGALYGK